MQVMTTHTLATFLAQQAKRKRLRNAEIKRKCEATKKAREIQRLKLALTQVLKHTRVVNYNSSERELITRIFDFVECFT